MAIDDIVRGLLVSGLSRTPYAGFLAGPLVDALWPQSGENIWEAIQDKVQALINQTLDQATKQQVTEDLAGLKNVMQNYLNAVKHPAGNSTFISENYVAASSQFDVARPHFMSQGHELLLLPLMAQMANLHLSLLRDGVKFGKTWGLTDSDVADQETQLQARISDYTNWVSTWYPGQIEMRPGDPNLQKGIALHRQLTMGAADYAFYWPMFDPQTNPTGVMLSAPAQEIYADPIAYTPGTLMWPPVEPCPGDPLVNLAVFAYNTQPPAASIPPLVGASCGYGRSGLARPYGIQPPPLQGLTPNDHAAVAVDPGGWSGGFPGTPIVEVGGAMSPSGAWTRAWFKFRNGENHFYTANVGDPNAADNYNLKYPDRMLSSVIVLAPDPNDPNAINPRGLLFGFRFEKSYSM